MTKYLLFLDECGSHDLAHVDPKWPLFVLVGLLVGETYYTKTLFRRVRALKARHGLRKDTLLHSREIRRQEGDFSFLGDQGRRARFYDDINRLFAGLRVGLYGVVIDKQRLQNLYLIPPNPYDISLSQILSLVCGPPGVLGFRRRNVVRIVAESRGKVEDKQLQAVYQDFRAFGLPSFGSDAVQDRRPKTVQTFFPGRVEFVRKSQVAAGLELTDLAAYPLARAYVNRNWDNPAYRIVAGKLREVVLFP